MKSLRGAGDSLLAALVVLLSRALLLAGATAGAFPGFGVAFRPKEALRAGAAAGRGCAWVPQPGLRAADLRQDSSSRMH